MVEQAAHNRHVGSSILPSATSYVGVSRVSVRTERRLHNLAVLELMVMCRQPSIPGEAQMAEHSTDNRAAVGSSPTSWTKRVRVQRAAGHVGYVGPAARITYADNSAGRVPVLHTGCRRFETVSAYQPCVTQPGRVSAFQAVRRKFESCHMVQSK